MEISSSKLSVVRSCRSLWLKRLENIVQDVGMLPIAVNALREGTGHFFDMVCNEAQGRPTQEESFMTTSNILLVNEDDLEIGIRLDNLGNRIQETSGRYLVEVRRRFMSLFDNMDVTARVNPVDTAGIARGLKAMLAELGSASIDEKMLIIDKIEKRLANTISSVYREIDKLLQDAGIPSANVVLTNVANNSLKKTASPWGNPFAIKSALDAKVDNQVEDSATASLIDGGFILPDMDDSGGSTFNFAQEEENPFNSPSSSPQPKNAEPPQSKPSQSAKVTQDVPAPAPAELPVPESIAATTASKEESAAFLNSQKNLSASVEKKATPPKSPIEPTQANVAPEPMMEAMPLPTPTPQPATLLAQPKTDSSSIPPAPPQQPPLADEPMLQPPPKPVIHFTGNALADLWNFLRRNDVPSPDEATLLLVRERIQKRLHYLHEGMEFDDEVPSVEQQQDSSDIYNLHQLFPDLFVPEAPHPNAEPELPNGLDSRAVGLTPGSAEAASLDAIDLIISVLIRNPEIPEPFKTFLHLIHPQLALFALSDSSIFTDPKHPFHICTKTLGALILGLPPDTPASHPVFDKLFESLRSPLRKLQKPVGPKVLENVVSKIQENLLARMIMREENLAITTNDYLPLLNLLEKRENVLNNIAQSISSHLLPKLPDVLRDFFEGPWQLRMQKMWLEKDNDKALWHEEFRMLNNLQQTFLPIKNDEEREKMSKTIPQVLQKMRQIMNECGLNDVQQKVILSICVHLQNRAIKGHEDGFDSFKQQTHLPDLRLRAELRMRRVHSGNKRLNTLYYTGKNNTKVPLPADFVPGVWLEFHVDRDTPCLARLCDVSDIHFWYLLANPDTQQFWALQPNVLEHQFAENRAHIITAFSPFELAARQVLKENT